MEKKLGLGSLTALVVGSMIGAGVFSLPQNMAAVASPAATLIGWIITGIGMTFLAFSFLFLSRIKPDIETGVFGYAQAGFGNFIGFNSAWGYWLSATLANVSYLVIVFSTFGMLFDTPDNILFGDGNTYLSLAGSSLLLWAIHLLVSKGVQTASLINLVTTIAKIVPLGIFIVFAFMAFKWDTFVFDFSGLHFGEETGLLDQVKACMLITVWVFVGIEGAVIVSSRAKHRQDIGRATIMGLATALTIYVLVSLLSMGVIKPVELAGYDNPSMAVILEHIIGPFGRLLISIALLISVCGAFLSWTVLASEAPYLAAKSNMFPSVFSKQNSAGSPINALLLTNGGVQISLLLVTYLGGTYDKLLIIASEMILVPYFLVAAYMLKIAIETKNRGSHLLVGILATVYGIWLLYASGLEYLLLSSLLYLPGVFFYLKARKEHQLTAFNTKDIGLLIALVIASMMAVYSLFSG
ncbi:basic amino acid/polyamine antiporter [Aliivibrio kagoshimensis]|uniref:basic amino acid/polyamine antiporter n=1 Tax=Aliivibrio kagoshimensis TaxID=2910230 RepID=UPI003D135C79